MHELSVCYGLIDQVADVARAQRALGVARIRVRVGPLSGVEPQLLLQAFPLARAGTVAEDAELEIEALPIRVHCERCNADTTVLPNRLVCGACGDWRTRVISGDELQLTSVELVTEEVA